MFELGHLDRLLFHHRFQTFLGAKSRNRLVIRGRNLERLLVDLNLARL